MDQKGYDFSGSKYGGVVTLPALNLTDYTAVTERGGSEVSPVATTTYTLISDTVNYTASVTSNSCVQIADEAGVHTVYSRYDYSLANNENQTLSWDEATGNYVYKAINPVIINGGASSVRSYGAQLVLIGDMTFNLTARLGANKGLIIGTETETANVLVNSTSTTYGIALWDGASLTVNKGSTLKVVGCTEDGIRGDKANTKIVIAGTVECANNLYSDSNSNIHVTSTGSLTLGKGLYLNNGANVTVDGTFVAGTYINVRSAGRLTVNGTAEAGTYVTVAGAAAEDSSYEYGFNPRLYIGGTLSVKGGKLTTNSMQIGSEKNNVSGTLNMHHSDNTCVVTDKNETRFAFAKGEVNITNSNTGKVGFDVRNAAATYIDIRSGFTFNKEKSGSLFGEWTTSNYHVSLQKGVIFNDISTISIGNKNVYLYGWDIQTVNIGGVEKQVKVTTVVAYTSKPSPYPNLSDTAFVALAEGATYTATGNTVSCGHLGTFNEATYIDADSITHTIYYQEIA